MPLQSTNFLVTPRVCESLKARLVCFPHSGGGPSNFTEWAEPLEKHGVEVVVVSLPGRERRVEEAPLTRWESIVDEVINALVESGLADDVPYAFFGHSLGALLAYEVARRASSTWVPERPRPLHLFVSGHGAPSTARSGAAFDKQALHKLDDVVLAEAVRSFGALPEEVTSNEGLLKAVLPALRADFEVYENYEPPAGRAPLALPITALGGDSDAIVPVETLATWAAETSIELSAPAVFPGGHFFIDTERDAVLALLQARILAVLAQLPRSLVKSNLSIPEIVNEKLMHEIVQERAMAQPNAEALVDDRVRYTYGDVASRMEFVASRLQGLMGDAEGQRIVGLLMPHEADYVIAMLAIWRAGAALIVLETHFPGEMIREICEASRTRAAVISPDHAPKFENITNVPTFVINGDLPSGSWPTAALAAPSLATPEDLCILSMTSGTTGRPKQIAGSHRFLHAGHLAKNQMLPYEQDDQKEAFNVMFVWEAIKPLLFGLTSFVLFDEAVLDPKLFVAFLQKHGCSRILTTPSLLSTILASCGDELDKRLSLMRTWYMCGEVLPMKTVTVFRQVLPRCRLMNDYSSWEAGDVGYAIVAPAPRYEPHGSPFALAGQAAPGSTLAILDPETKQILPMGVPGELYCGGTAMSSGYYEQQALTDERFVDPPTPEMAAVWAGKWYKSGDCGRLIAGESPILEVRGRIDFTVKIRGFKVGIPVVEGAVQGVGGVALCCVVPLYESAAVVDSLLCFVKPEEGAEYDAVVQRVKREAVMKIPRWMMPTYFRPMPADSTSGGESRKLDRKKLARMFDLQTLRDQAAAARSASAGATTASNAAGDAEEEGPRAIVKAVWAKSLNLDVHALDLDENFFDLGGHSQLAAKIATELSDTYGVSVSVLDIYAHSSLGALLDFIDSQGAAKAEKAAVVTDLALPRGRRQPTEGISVVGMAGRFPGADAVEAFWENLKVGAVAATFMSKEFLRRKGVPEETIAHSDFVPVAYMINDADKFDHQFFGIGRHEASLMDPQHRVFIEAAWAAMENAALSPKAGLAGAVVGMWAAAGIDGYLVHHLEGAPLRNTMDPQDIFLTEIGNEKDYIATRVSYLLDFTGPSMNVNSACSSALVACVQGAAGIAAGQCDAAIAGASSITFPNLGYLYQDGLVSSVDGFVRPFDAGADGTVFGDSVAALVLRRKDEVDGTLQWATMRGFSVSNDGGRKAGYAAPSSEGQSRAVMFAMEMLGEDPWSISYVECHATGTRIGDGIEVRGLLDSFEKIGGKRTLGESGPVALGSVKGNIAHANCAAGVTGLVKTLLMMGGNQLVPTANFKVLNSKVNLSGTPFSINSELCPWLLDAGKPRRAGVSSFGIGGTNAHIILEAPESPDFSVPPVSREVGLFHLLPFSAKSPVALRNTADAVADGLRRKTDGVAMSEVAYTMQTGRAALPLRKAVVLSAAGAGTPGLEQLAEQLQSEFPDVEELEDLEEAPKRPKVAFVFPGQGSQYFQMARGLYASVQLFRAMADEACELLSTPGRLGVDLRPTLFPDNPTCDEKLEKEFSRPTVTQPALFVVEHALCQVFKAVGVSPVAVAGHSLGEYAAAVAGGLLSLEQAVDIVAARAKSTETLAEDGAMLSVSDWSDAELDAIAKGSRPGLWLAAVNSPVHAVISGETAAIDALDAELKAAGKKSAKLHVQKAFHSGLIAKAADTLRGLGKTPSGTSSAGVPVASNYSGDWLSATNLQDGSYWAEHMRGTVQWRRNAENLLSQRSPAVVLEVGPGSALSMLTAKCVAKGDDAPVFVQAMRHPKAVNTHDVEALLAAIGRLWECGCSIDWRELYTKVLRVEPPAPIRLPTYAFDRTSLWVNPARSVYVEKVEDPSPAAYVVGANATPAAIALSNAASSASSSKRALLRFGDRRAQEPSIKAYCLPFASGSATLFAPWSEGAEDAVEVVAIELPGRGGRSEEAISGDDAGDEALINTLCDLILADIRGAQYVLVGFSMGGGLSVELALRLAARGAPPPLALYVAGRKPPALDPAVVGDLAFTNEELAAYAFAPPELASSPEFMEHVVPLLRSDLGVDNRTERRLSAASVAGRAVLSAGVGLEIFCGVTDEVAPFRDAPGWQRFARMPIGMHYYPGGHEFMQEHRLMIYAALRRDAIGRLVQRRSAELAILASQGFAAAGAPVAQAAMVPAAPGSASAQGGELPLYAVRWVPATSSTHQASPVQPQAFVDLGSELSPVALEEVVVAVQGGAVVVAACGPSKGVLSGRAGAVDDEVSQCWRFTQVIQRLLNAGVAGRLVVVCPAAASGAMVSGASKAVAMEANELRIQRIFVPDMCLADSQKLTETFVSLADRFPAETDLWADSAGLQGRIFTPRLEPLRAPSSKLPCVPKIGPDGESAMYVLTGATGGLGRAVVEWLLRDQGLLPEQLVLLRRPGSSALTGDLARCRVVEVARPDSSDDLLASGLQVLPTVTGLLHLAGVLDDGIVGGMTEERFRKVAEPKCGILAALVRAATVLGWPMQWIIGFSSTSSLFGYAGQSNYCAANAILDHLAAFGSSLPEGDRPPCRVLAINWGPWGEAGMAKVGTKAYEQALAEGDRPLPTATALKCLAAGLRILGQAQPSAAQLCACDVAWQRSQWRDLPMLELVAESSKEDALEAAASSPCEKDNKADLTSGLSRVQEFMTSHTKSGGTWKRIQGKSLHQLGMDSLEIVQLRNMFNKKFGVNAPLSLLADPSQKLTDLAKALNEHISA